MLISDFVLIPLPMAEVVGRLKDRVAGGLGAHAAAAEDDVHPLRATSGHEIWGRPLHTQVEIALGEPRAHDHGRILLALRWVGTGRAGPVFPVLEGDLELASVGDQATQVTLFGRYEPAPQHLGGDSDRAALHRVAQSTVRAFLRRVAAAINSEPLAGAARH